MHGILQPGGYQATLQLGMKIQENEGLPSPCLSSTPLGPHWHSFYPDQPPVPEIQSGDQKHRRIPPETELVYRTGMWPCTSSLFPAGPGTVLITKNHRFSGVRKPQRSFDSSPYPPCQCLIIT